MSPAESDREEQILKLAEAGFSTRRIASAIGDISQSTVVRILKKADSGPQPLWTESAPQPGSSLSWPAVRRVALILFLGLMSVTFIVLTAAVATIAWG